MKKSYDRLIFGDFDFRKHARLIDKILSFILIIIFFSGLFFAAIAMILTGISKLM